MAQAVNSVPTRGVWFESGNGWFFLHGAEAYQRRYSMEKDQYVGYEKV
jgi:hypothetical protein